MAIEIIDTCGKNRLKYAPIAKAMAGGASDYDLTVTHTFIDGLLGAITFGIYTPTTIIVKK